MDYPWYKIVASNTDIKQGDFINECPIIIPPENITEDLISKEEGIEIQLINSIVLSQSCDLEYDKLEIVLVCPYYCLSEFLENMNPKNKKEKEKEKIIRNLQKGYYPSYHLLNKHTEADSDHMVVDFKNVYGINFDALKNIIKNRNDRLRLLPPYREHLSQAFARYFMRVGLPQDISI